MIYGRRIGSRSGKSIWTVWRPVKRALRSKPRAGRPGISAFTATAGWSFVRMVKSSPGQLWRRSHPGLVTPEWPRRVCMSRPIIAAAESASNYFKPSSNPPNETESGLSAVQLFRRTRPASNYSWPAASASSADANASANITASGETPSSPSGEVRWWGRRNRLIDMQGKRLLEAKLIRDPEISISKTAQESKSGYAAKSCRDLRHPYAAHQAIKAQGKNLYANYKDRKRSGISSTQNHRLGGDSTPSQPIVH